MNCDQGNKPYDLDTESEKGLFPNLWIFKRMSIKVWSLWEKWTIRDTEWWWDRISMPSSSQTAVSQQPWSEKSLENMHQLQLTTVGISPNGIWTIRFGDKNEVIGQRDLASCFTHYSNNTCTALLRLILRLRWIWSNTLDADLTQTTWKILKSWKTSGFMISELTAYDTNQDSIVLKK